MTTTYRRIDEHTAERITVNRHEHTISHCEQCDMHGRYTDHPIAPGNRQQRAGETRCYACQWANVSLSGRKYAGISFDEFIDKKNYVQTVQGII